MKRKSNGEAPAAPSPAGGKPATPEAPFWRVKTLEDMTASEWESLCDGCGRCCLVKLIDEDTEEIHYTDIACKLFDAGTCACKDYQNRKASVPDCVKLTPKEVRTLPWLPPTCAYGLVARGKDLRWWHPLVSGRPETVHEAGISVRGRVGAVEGKIRQREYVDHIVDWPNREPRPPKPKD